MSVSGRLGGLVVVLVACGSRVDPTESTQAWGCRDTHDNDGDGQVDCADTDCAASADCSASDTGAESDENRAPTEPVVFIEPVAPVAGEALDCLLEVPSMDPDGDAVAYAFSWSRRVDAGYQPALDGSSVPEGETSESEHWRCTVRASDGRAVARAAGAVVEIGAVESLGSPPTEPTVAIYPDTPSEGESLACVITGASTDADADDIIGYRFAWSVSAADQTVWTDPGIGVSVVEAGFTASGDRWRCTVTPNDGTQDGDSGAAWVEVAAS